MTYTDLISASRALIEALSTQDNAATADPIFYVEVRERIYGMDFEEFDGSYVWVREDECDVEADEAEAKALDEKYADTGDDPIDGWRRLGHIDTWKKVQPFFTRDGAQRYLDANRHNLKEPRIYVGSAYRNSEWQYVRSKLPLALQGLEDALKVVEAARGWHGHGTPQPDACELCAALAHFDAREKEGAP